ncbi:related to Quinidine resistance protein 3 [Saccharomycodes ludwigii]|uniref:Related to Quinidine resistance protein 3 n=1 Tax=Saccharomycodes ludwigii TaxID=36035 RepID=A0A376BB78_9ASCO|nr:hypothetical protein SCDLUD_003618 [Saccharomycodes ludwigii]KAH3900625.1 hypothetical protein SCDLUD_003618 [Saccharomycodes ludwigii]SSD61935.1 related to Quinidine resistance protein 3 [Saccharomycodes ludwigii]
MNHLHSEEDNNSSRMSISQSIVSSIERYDANDYSENLQNNIKDQQPTQYYANNASHDENDNIGKGAEPTDENLSLEKSVTNLRKNKELLVPRKKRRGLLAQLAIVPEYKDARDYPPAVKKFIVFLVAYASIMGPMGTSIIFPCINEIVEDFNTTTIKVNVSVGIYLLSLGIFPLWWSSISEFRGRRTVYVISFTLLFAFNIGCGLCKNIESFIILRVLCGGSSASVQSVGAGTIADLYAPEQRGKNLGLYYLGPLMAPLLSPIFGSLLVNRWSWKSTQWFMVILAGVNVILLILLLPETLRLQDNKQAIINALRERKEASRKHNLEVAAAAAAAASNSSTSTSTAVSEEDVEYFKMHINDNNKTATTKYKDDEEETGNNYNNNGKKKDHDQVNIDERVIERVLTSNRENTLTNEEYNEDNNSEDEQNLPPILDPLTPQITKITTRNRHDINLEKELREQNMEKVLTEIDVEIGQEQETNEDTEEKKSNWKHTLYIYLIKPLKSVVFLKYPPVALAIAFSSITFSCVYFVNITVEYSYSRSPYNFRPLYIGLLYIPNSVTYILASIFGGKWVDQLLVDYKKKHGYLAPQARISYNVVASVIAFPVSLIIFGWCLDKKQHWVTPLVGTALFGFASMMTIGAVVSYLVDSLPGRGATGVALNNLIRQIFAAVAVFVDEPMLLGMTTGWAFTMLAFIVLGSSVVLIILKKKSDYWSEHYDLEHLYEIVSR